MGLIIYWISDKNDLLNRSGNKFSLEKLGNS